jgi:hypothetical protein
MEPAMTHLRHMQPFLRQTPFHDRLSGLCHSNDWIRWMGFMAPNSFDSVQLEYFAIRNGATSSTSAMVVPHPGPRRVYPSSSHRDVTR